MSIISALVGALIFAVGMFAERVIWAVFILLCARWVANRLRRVAARVRARFDIVRARLTRAIFWVRDHWEVRIPQPRRA